MTVSETSASTPTDHQFRRGQHVADGDSARFYEVAGETDRLLKVYRSPLSVEEQERIDRLVGTGPPKPGAAFAWPLRRIRDGISDAIVLPRVENDIALANLFDPARRGGAFRGATWRDYADIARLIAEAVALLHRDGVVFAALSDRKVLLKPGPQAVLIGCDACQSEGDKLAVTVNPRWLPPELAENPDAEPRSRNHDNFALAQLIFMILFLGETPQDQADDKAGVVPSRFATAGGSPGRGAADPRLRLVSHRLGAMFDAAFAADPQSSQTRPSAATWAEELGRFRESLTQCARITTHYHLRGTYCPWCHLARTGKDPFDGPGVTGTVGGYGDPRVRATEHRRQLRRQRQRAILGGILVAISASWRAAARTRHLLSAVLRHRRIAAGTLLALVAVILVGISQFQRPRPSHPPPRITYQPPAPQYRAYNPPAAPIPRVVPFPAPEAPPKTVSRPEDLPVPAPVTQPLSPDRLPQLASGLASLGYDTRNLLEDANALRAAANLPTRSELSSDLFELLSAPPPPEIRAATLLDLAHEAYLRKARPEARHFLAEASAMRTDPEFQLIVARFALGHDDRGEAQTRLSALARRTDAPSPAAEARALLAHFPARPTNPSEGDSELASKCDEILHQLSLGHMPEGNLALVHKCDNLVNGGRRNR